MGFFGGIGKASGKGQRGEYLPEFFEGDVEIEKVSVIKTRAKGSRGESNALIVEFKVCSNMGSVQVPVGSQRNWFQGLWNTDVAWPEILRFVYATLGMTVDEGEEKLADEKTREAVLDAACGTEQKFKGRKLHVRMYRKDTLKSRASGKAEDEIIIPAFSPYVEKSAAA